MPIKENARKLLKTKQDFQKSPALTLFMLWQEMKMDMDEMKDEIDKLIEKIPKGEKGDVGERGPRGPIGMTGKNGRS